MEFAFIFVANFFCQSCCWWNHNSNWYFHQFSAQWNDDGKRHSQFNFFDFLIPGVLATFGVLVACVLLAPVFLKKRDKTIVPTSLSERSYTTELKVIPNGSMDGKSIKKARLGT